MVCTQPPLHIVAKVKNFFKFRAKYKKLRKSKTTMSMLKSNTTMQKGREHSDTQSRDFKSLWYLTTGYCDKPINPVTRSKTRYAERKAFTLSCDQLSPHLRCNFCFDSPFYRPVGVVATDIWAVLPAMHRRQHRAVAIVLLQCIWNNPIFIWETNLRIFW